MSQTPLPICYMSDLFRLHDPGQGHPERPARYDAVAAAVASSGAERREAPSASHEALERVHAPAYVELIERFCAGGGGALDPDTIVPEASWGAALRAAGGAIAAAEAVAGEGAGATVNLPLAAGTSEDAYLAAFHEQALPAVTGFRPDLVIV